MIKRVIVGLGNPGQEYEHTYHNAGRLALLPLARAGEVSWKKEKLFEYAEHGTEVLVRPLTYMNESGKAVSAAMKKFNAKPEMLVVAHDDSDIIVGHYKISFGRSSAGHKGVQSVIDALKTNAFTRVRIGIRPAREKQRQKAGEFALKQITPRDKKALEGVFSDASDHLYKNVI